MGSDFVCRSVLAGVYNECINNSELGRILGAALRAVDDPFRNMSSKKKKERLG